jgi:hypothetical protein
MGYSKSKNAIKRVEEYLKQLVENESQQEFSSADSHALSHLIFEGIQASKEYAKEGSPYLEYSGLGAKFKIQTKPDRVICQPRNASILTRSSSLASVTIPGVSDPVGIIGAAIKHKSPIMIFPDHNGSMPLIYNWASKHDYFLVRTKEGLVITKDENAREAAWHPN